MCRACVADHASALACRERLPEYLGHLYLFRGLADEHLEQVVASTRTMQVEDGRWLYREGERAERFYVVREGQIALFRQSPEGRESVIAIVGADEVFGDELLYLEEAHFDVNARAIGECALLSIDRSGIRPLLESSAELCQRVIKTLHQRQQMLLDHIERLTLKDATQRLVAYLLDQIGNETGPKRLRLTVPKSMLAAHLSIQPETLSRILTRLKECHYLREEEADLIILAPQELRAGHGCSFCHLRTWGCPGPTQKPVDAHEPIGNALPLAH